ncbi:MAG: hypothetical protein JWQ73_590 [Variovorax sp.]|nr:hypothetical protein [Variovorax sp.]
MKKIFISFLLAATALVSLPLSAQSVATAGNTDFAAERSRLTAERATVDKNFDNERAACFKKFAVESCLEDSRRSKRDALDNIKRQEAIINDAERKRRGAAALDRLDEKSAPQRAEDAAKQRDQALKSQATREQRAADHTTGREATAAGEAAKREQFENKQKEHAEHLAKNAKSSAQAPVEQKQFDDKVQKAEAHRADIQKRNAERTKPRSASLPPPP